jgi:purine-binding chemotaxis protein CheW
MAMGAYIIFQIDETDYGISIDQIKQLDVMGKVTPVPNAPDYVEGIVFTRGEVIPAINVRKKYGLTPKEFDIKTRLIHINASSRSFGLIVDSAREFINISDDQILPPPSQGDSPFTSELIGIAKHNDKIILLLDPLKMAVDEQSITESSKK